MTTDLSELHPHKDFFDAEPRKASRHWVWGLVGLGALAASGFAAFSALPLGSAPQKPSDERLNAPIEKPSELEQISSAALMGSESDESDETDSAMPGLPPAAEQAAPAAAAPVSAEPSSEPAQPTPAAATEGVAPIGEIGDGSFYVQLASYHTKETAEAHAARLAEQGLPAKTFAYGGPAAGWWHAVRMGPFKSRFEAEKSRFSLRPNERRDAYVLPRSNGKFHVQVASFAEREQADRIARRFTSLGHSTKVSRITMSGSAWYCVRIGPFDTREEAENYKALVQDVPGSESTVIPFGPPPEQP